MLEYDAEKDEALQRYHAETNRVSALAEFLKLDVLVPHGRDEKADPALLKDYRAAWEESIEAVRRIASRS